MAPATETKIHELVTKLEQRNAAALKLLYSVFALLLTLLISAGIGIEKYNNLKNKVDFIDHNYLPMMFVDGMQQNQMIMTEELVARFSGASKQEITEIMDKYVRFQKTMNEQMIEMKKVMNSRTRSIKTLSLQ